MLKVIYKQDSGEIVHISTTTDTAFKNLMEGYAAIAVNEIEMPTVTSHKIDTETQTLIEIADMPNSPR